MDEVRRLELGIERLNVRLKQVREFEPRSLMSAMGTPTLQTLQISVYQGLAKTFGEGTEDFERYSAAAVFDGEGNGLAGDFGLWHSVEKSKQRSIAYLEQAIFYLQECHSEESEKVFYPPVGVGGQTVREAPALTRKIFVVHGHDAGARESVARFIERIGFKAVILHEQANKGGTVIEKIEAHGDVGFAVVLLTPDDEGRKRGATDLEPRARQNVLLELGYFLARLGRDRVCALKSGDVEIPSDFAGVVWQPFDDGGGWRQALGRELQAVGHDIDWNLVMSS